MDSSSGSFESKEKSDRESEPLADDDEDEIVTMQDVLEQQREQEADANAVLGNCDDKICTYSEGYVGRQPLYACRTCCKDKMAGVCLACSYKCHEGHDLIELYTKRFFRCDCGNSLFTSNCSLDPVKDDENELNKYNKNFKGLYCICDRPYPDPEDDVEDVMTQCVVCEDWYHGRHLEGREESAETEGEMICQLCMEKLPFLKLYLDLQVAEATGPCKVAGLSPPTASSSATYWSAGWRSALCRCTNCIKLYASKQISFVTEETDSVMAFEARNKQAALESQDEREMRALNSLDHVKKVEAIQGYNDMKTALMKHLQKFQEGNKVVSEKDIREFFEEFQAKRRRIYVPPASCR